MLLYSISMLGPSPDNLAPWPLPPRPVTPELPEYVGPRADTNVSTRPRHQHQQQSDQAAPPVTQDIGLAKRYLELLTGSEDTKVHFRIIHDSDKRKDGGSPAESWPLATLEQKWPLMLKAQSRGYGIFMVVNEGGHNDAVIYKSGRLRAHFTDADGKPLPAKWHLEPDFVVERDSTHNHTYWILDQGVLAETKEFKSTQLRLAVYYGTDRTVQNLSRIMRLPGTLHLKDPHKPRLVKLIEFRTEAEPRRTLNQVLQGIPEIQVTKVEPEQGARGRD